MQHLPTFALHSEHNRYNGWSTDPGWLQRLFELHAQNNVFVPGYATHQQFVHSATYQPQHNFPMWETLDNNVAQLFHTVDLDHIPSGKSYIYPIKIWGVWQPGYHYQYRRHGQVECVHIPHRVCADARNNQCKILFHEHWEGSGYNLSFYKTFFEHIQAQYNLPTSSIGFVDHNAQTPQLQRSYNTRGFAILFFEQLMYQQIGLHTLTHNQKRCAQALESKPYRFISLNRMLRSHRTQITFELFKNHSHNSVWSYLAVPCAHNRSATIDDHSTVDADYKKCLPKIVDYEEKDMLANINDINHTLQHSAHINIINEAFFYRNNSSFLTEKTFKAIAHGQPFIIVGTPGLLKLLRSYGYKTFNGFIDESYDSIQDHQQRMAAIITEIRRLSAMPLQEFCDLMSECYKIALHNLNTFEYRGKNQLTYREFAHQLADWQYNN